MLGAEEGEGRGGLQENVERVSRAFSYRKLEAFSEPLIEHLANEPESVDALHALLVLGLSHPKFFARHEEKLLGEGRRLSTMLEKSGDTQGALALLEALSWKNPDDWEVHRDLAVMMQRTGNADHLIERYLRRAETAIGEGRRDDAVDWLREVLTIDRSRRDVARMIRDLHFDQTRKRRSLRTAARTVFSFLVVIGLIAGAVYRETWIDSRFESILQVEANDIASKRARLLEIDELIASNPLWFGAFRASSERKDLRQDIAMLEGLAADAALKRGAAATERRNMADSARIRARILIESGEFEEALVQLRIARENAPEGWEHRPRLDADYDAIQAVLKHAGTEDGEDGP